MDIYCFILESRPKCLKKEIKKTHVSKIKVLNSQKIFKIFLELTVYTVDWLVLKHVFKCLNIFYQTLKSLGISDWIASEMKSASRRN